MANEAPFDLKPQEIAALMCAVANDNLWRRGKRSFMICSRNLYGINLTFREKGTQVALSCPNWRVGATVNYRGQNEGGVLVKVPQMHTPYERVNRRNVRQPPVTMIRDAIMWSPQLEIYTTQSRFERDWVLLRMFSGEWAEYAAG